MKAKQSQSINYFFIILVFVGILIGMIFFRGNLALDGILWGLNKGRLGLIRDQVYCRVFGLEKCSVNYSDLKVNFGAYDLNDTLSSNSKLAIDHKFYNWNSSTLVADLNSDFISSKQKNRWLLVTLEPFAMESKSADVLTDTVTGVYDKNIVDFCSAINNSPTPVFVRWGHEMENVTGRYPWAVSDSAKFINAYNYFVDKCRTQTNNAYFMWSPLGKEGLEHYWPGEKNVDFVGVSLYVLPAYERNNSYWVRSFDELFYPTYTKISGYNKPIIIAELGVEKGSMQAPWWYNMLKNVNKYPKLKTIVYFNSIDNAGVWPGYDTPDWEFDASVFPMVHD